MTAVAPARRRHTSPGTVPLARALSKLGVASRSEARQLVLDGRVRIDGRVVRDPRRVVVPERVQVEIDGVAATRAPARTIGLHKPKGVVTTRRDPEGRPTVYELIADAGAGLAPVGRLDLASTGLLLCTTDTAFGAWLTNPAHAVEREYVVTVRGRVAPETARAAEAGVAVAGEPLRARSVHVRKASTRETHLTVVLDEGKNREIRRLFLALGHEVTRLTRVRIGGLELGDLEPGAWRILSAKTIADAFPGYSGRRSSRPQQRRPVRQRPQGGPA